MLRPHVLFLALTASAALAGCTISTSEIGGSGCGEVGDFCWDDEECGHGLVCGEDSTCETDPNAISNGTGSGQGATVGGGGDGGGGAGSGGAGGGDVISCQSHADCNNGFYCANGTCEAGAIPCAELADEAACASRSDCEPVYAGVNCSCGPNCQCEPGDVGCVCESFEYFACADAP